jgi:hypothetical protein
MTSRRIGTIALACVLGTGIYIAGLSAAPTAAAPQAADRSIAQISQERLGVATRGYKRAQANFKAGVVDYNHVGEWVWRRAAAARDLPDVTQRIAVLQECVTELTAQVDAAAQRSKIGAASPDDSFTAQDRALECELWLAKSHENR